MIIYFFPFKKDGTSWLLNVFNTENHREHYLFGTYSVGISIYSVLRLILYSRT